MNIFILGLGSIGLRHAGNFLDLGCKVFGFDPAPQSRKAAEDAGCTTFKTREDVFANAKSGDGIVIATPTKFHADDIISALKTGAHVFVEKPITHSLSDGFVECVTNRRPDQIIFPAMNLRYHPVVEFMKSRIQAGALGELDWGDFHCSSYLPNWRPAQDHKKGYAADPVGGGVVLDIVHEFDIAWHLLGSYDIKSGTILDTGKIGIGTSDMAIAVAIHDHGGVSNIHVDYVSQVPFRRTIISGSEGRIEGDLIRRTVKETDTQGNENETTFDGSFSDDYVTEAKSFLACIDGTELPRCSAEEALSVISALSDFMANHNVNRIA